MVNSVHEGLNGVDFLQVDLTSFLGSGASSIGREAPKRATKSPEVVPRHIKSSEGLFWKSINGVVALTVDG